MFYLYGVVPRAERLPTELPPRLQAVSEASLSALVEPVTTDEFASQVLDTKLQSMDWMTRQANKHQSVLDRVLRHGPVIPARVCTMFSDIEAVEQSLRRDADRFGALLQTLEGRNEWSVKVFCDEELLRALISREQGVQTWIGPLGFGHAFAFRKREAVRVIELVDATIDDCVEEVLERLEDLVFDSRMRPLLSETATGRRDSMALNLAVLLHEGHRQALCDAIEDLSGDYSAAFSVELSGPWPAYSFCDERGDPGDGYDVFDA